MNFPSNNSVLIDIEQQGEVYVLRCRGRLVAGQDAEYVRAKMDEIKSLNCSKVVADFREVPAISSMGISFLVGVYASVTGNSGGRFVLAGACPLVQQVLRLTKLNTVIPSAGDLASGVEALQRVAAVSNCQV